MSFIEILLILLLGWIIGGNYILPTLYTYSSFVAFVQKSIPAVYVQNAEQYYWKYVYSYEGAVTFGIIVFLYLYYRLTRKVSKSYLKVEKKDFVPKIMVRHNIHQFLQTVSFPFVVGSTNGFWFTVSHSLFLKISQGIRIPTTLCTECICITRI